MSRFDQHRTAFAVFIVVLGFVTLLGFLAARWRRRDVPEDLELWGLGGRAFGNFVTLFLLGGDIYSAYTYVAVPALVYSVGGLGTFALAVTMIHYPLCYVVFPRIWSICHVHGFLTPSEFVRARFGSRTLSLLVAITCIVATMPYIALQLVGLEAVLKVMGVGGSWPLTAAFVVLALYTFRSGLRAPALISIVKDALILWTVLAALVIVAGSLGGWGKVFHDAATRFAAAPSSGHGILLAPGGDLGFITLVVGSAFAFVLYPHILTGVLAARNRPTVVRNVAALPVYSLLLGVIAMLGLLAISAGVQPIDGDGTTIVPALLDNLLPGWCAGLVFAAIGVGALVPAAIMSIAAANLFTRSIYREYIRPHATSAQETRVSKFASLAVKGGALLAIVVLRPQFAIDFQLIGSVIIIQAMPSVGIGLFTAWLDRRALVAGLIGGLLTSVVLLYEIPQLGPGGRIVRAHFGGSSWPLANWGLHTQQSVYVGIVALVVNLVVAVVVTLAVRALRLPAGVDMTGVAEYEADEGGTEIRRLVELVDGVSPRGAHVGQG